MIRNKRRFWTRTLGVALLSYVTALAFPQMAFANRIDRGSFSVYAHHPVDPAITHLIDEAAARTAKSPLERSDVRSRVFLTSSFVEYAFFAPKGRSALAVTYHFLGTTFVNRSNVTTNEVFRPLPGSSRSLRAVLAHERVHRLIEARYGVLRAFMAPAWKTEGYCEYVAGEPSVDSPYAVYLTRVRFLIDIRHLTFDDIMGKDFDLRSLDRQVDEPQFR